MVGQGQTRIRRAVMKTRRRDRIRNEDKRGLATTMRRMGIRRPAHQQQDAPQRDPRSA